MIPTCSPFSRGFALALACTLSSVPLSAEATTLTRTHSGAWNATGAWTADNDPINWIQAANAIIPDGLSVSVDAAVNVSDLQLHGTVQVSNHPLTILGTPSGDGRFTMPNISVDELGGSGLVVQSGHPVEMRHRISLADATNGKVVVTALDEGTELIYNGHWEGRGSNTRHDIRIGGGARFIFGPEAQVNNQMLDLVRARAFYANGDGHPDNVFEFHEEFNADMGTAETPAGGLSTLRVGSLTLITHASQNLPTIHKFKGDGSPTHHGLLIFDQDDQAHWKVKTQNQWYDGGIYWDYDWILTTETDLDSIPINAPGEDVGFGSKKTGTTLTKRGTGTLRLDHAQGYAPETTFRIEEGTVEFLSNPFQTWPGGFMASAGNHLSLDVLASGSARLLPPAGEIFSLEGVVLSGGLLHLGAGRLSVSTGLSATEGSSFRILLGAGDFEAPKLDLPHATLQASLTIEAGAGFGPGEYPLFPADADLAGNFTSLTMPSGYLASFSADTGILTIVAVEVIDYTAWQDLWFAEGDPSSGPYDDFSGDGLLNILAYAFAFNPREPTALDAIPGAPRIVSRPEGLAYRFSPAPARTGVTFHVEASPDLSSWQTVPPVELPGSGIAQELGVWLHDVTPLRFFRLGVFLED